MATWNDVASVVGELPRSKERSPREWRVGKKLIVEAWLTQAPKRLVREFLDDTK
jgi:hypothetical protein